MNAVRRFIGLFQDSPTYGRDRANLVSGASIGITALLLLLLLLPY
jgi:hypothetical protein